MNNFVLVVATFFSEKIRKYRRTEIIIKKYAIIMIVVKCSYIIYLCMTRNI